MKLNTYTDVIEQYKAALAPVQKLTDLGVANVEKLAALQIKSIEVYSNLAISQLKAALSVQDIEGLKTYLADQQEVVKTVSEKLASDAKSVVELGEKFTAEAQKVAEETLEAASLKAA